jgi:ATP phosphoribosyltransferase
MLSLALPNGSLEHATLDLFAAADLTVRRVSKRGYRASIDDPRIECVRFLRPQEIASYVERGLFDMGITGHDWISETDSQVVSLSELGYSRATATPIRIVLAVPRDAPWHHVTDLPDDLRIATEFPALTHRFLDEQCIKAEVMTSYGATEAKVPDIADAIVDLTETGSSLRENGLRVLATLLTSTPELIANREAYDDLRKQQAMDEIASLLRSAGDARDRVLLKMNLTDPPPAIKTILGLECTITHSYSAPLGMHAIEVVVPKKGINVLIPRLRAAGAVNIMELPLAKFMY